jgi:hypothetical protein
LFDPDGHPRIIKGKEIIFSRCQILGTATPKASQQQKLISTVTIDDMGRRMGLEDIQK